MKTGYLLILIGLLFGCSGQPKEKTGNNENPSTEKSLPKFEISEEIHNFGMLKAGEIAVYSFVYKNSGEGILEIKNIETECSCLTVEPEGKVVKPGETGKIKVIFNTSGLFGDQLQAFRVLSTREGIGMNLAIAAKVMNDDIEIKQ